MIQTVEHRFEGSFDGKKVGDKARYSVDRPFKPQLDAVGMAVQLPAAMVFAGMGQRMRGLETKSLRDFHR